MSFQKEIYPHRTNRFEFANRLLRRVDIEWKKVTTCGNSYVMPGGVNRSSAIPVYLDRQRVKALLKAWLRQLPPANDRYLDLPVIQKLEWTAFGDSGRAFEAIRRNATEGGAVKFLMNEIERSGTGQASSVVLFGPSLFNNWTYDTYFSQLLAWDDNHCYGLIRELTMQEARNRLGGGSTLHPVWRAARQWIVSNKSTGVYSMYNIQFS